MEEPVEVGKSVITGKPLFELNGHFLTEWIGLGYYPSSNGRSCVKIKCGFCGAKTEAYVWSLSGSGKKCECGAIHSRWGNSKKIIIAEKQTKSSGSNLTVQGKIKKEDVK